MKIIREKSFYQMLAKIAFPLALQNLISVGVSMTDTVVLGRLGETAISASSLANQLYFIFTFILFGLSGGTIVLSAQYWGKGDKDTISKIMGITLRISVPVGLIFTLIGLVFPREFMTLYTKDADVIAAGTSYLRIIAPSYLINAITVIYLAVLRSMENVKISLFVSCTSFLVNLALNPVLIFGLYGAPKLGVAGASTATMTARTVELLIVVVYYTFIDKNFRFRFRHLFLHDRDLFHDYIRYSGPVILSESLWGTGVSVQAAILGNLGKYASASANIVSVMQRLTTVLIFGVCDAATVVLGKKIGSGDEKGARLAANTFLVLSSGMGVFSAFLVGGLGSAAISSGIFTMTNITRGYVHIMLYGASVYVFCQSITGMNIVGIMRAGGDTRAALLIDSMTLWFLSLPAGLTAGYLLHLAPPYVFICMCCDEFVKVFICLYRFRKDKWLHNVTR
jgi:putative efflux protein, MATE family